MMPPRPDPAPLSETELTKMERLWQPPSIHADLDVPRLLATVRALQQRQTWQPIATAPKNADIWLLLWEPSGVVIGAYVDFGATVPEGYRHGWFASMDGHYEIHPTHWMPLPNPPEEPLDAD